MEKVICDKCNGTKKQNDPMILWIPGSGYTGGISFKCTKCHGEGELDWIERIVGKKGPVFYNEGDEISVEAEDFPWYLIKEK
jgi:hypothetical protein